MANAADYFADVKKYASSYDEDAIAGIVRHCGIALAKKDSSLVSGSDPKELARVKASFLIKKLGLPDDGKLDDAIASVMAKMAGDRTKERVTVYYMLAEHFGKLDLFKK
jgi:3-dehydroquinate synthetase